MLFFPHTEPARDKARRDLRWELDLAQSDQQPQGAGQVREESGR